jgi:hypothetical protein
LTPAEKRCSAVSWLMLRIKTGSGAGKLNTVEYGKSPYSCRGGYYLLL